MEPESVPVDGNDTPILDPPQLRARVAFPLAFEGQRPFLEVMGHT